MMSTCWTHSPVVPPVVSTVMAFVFSDARARTRMSPAVTVTGPMDFGLVVVDQEVVSVQETRFGCAILPHTQSNFSGWGRCRSVLKRPTGPRTRHPRIAVHVLVVRCGQGDARVRAVCQPWIGCGDERVTAQDLPIG